MKDVYASVLGHCCALLVCNRNMGVTHTMGEVLGCNTQELKSSESQRSSLIDVGRKPATPHFLSNSIRQHPCGSSYK